MLTNRCQLTREQTGYKLLESATDLKVSLKRSGLGFEIEYELSGFATGDTPQEARELINEAVSVHIDSLRRHDEPVPPPTATTHTVHAA